MPKLPLSESARIEVTRINATTQRSNPFFLWLLNHARAFIFSLGDLLRHPIAYFFTVLIIGIVMSLPAGLYVLLDNAKTLTAHWQGRPTISLYLKREASAPQITRLADIIKKNPGIESLEIISAEDGLKIFKKNAPFGDVLNALEENPIPTTLVVTPTLEHTSPEALNALFAQLKSLPIIDTAKFDQAWLQRLYFLTQMTERITFALATLFGIAVLLIVANTVRLALQSHRQEIHVMQLIGATHSFVRRPLLYRGLCFGLLGGAIAWAIIAGILLWLQPPAAALAKSYHNSSWLLRGLSLEAGLRLVGFCALLSWVGAWVSSEKYLRS